MKTTTAGTAQPAEALSLRRHPTPRLRAYTTIAVLGLLAGLASGRPELVAVAAPAALAVAIALARAGDADVQVGVSLERLRALEDEPVDLTVTLQATRRLPAVTVFPLVGDALACDGAVVGQDDGLTHPGPAVVGLEPGQETSVRMRLRARRWGVHRAGALRIVAEQTLGLFTASGEITFPLSLRAYPAAERLRHLLEPAETQLHVGNRRSRASGVGIEYADARALQPGDDPRSINWRVTARRQALWVTERHPERNSDIVLFVDTLAEARQAMTGTLELAVRAAAGLAAGYLGQRDRVGLISFGGALQWLRAGMGDVQRYRILDALLTSQVWATYVWTGVRAVPPHALPPKALVIGLSPLLDPRVVEAFADLRGRGFDLAVVEVAPETFLPAPVDRPGRLAQRWWQLERAGVRTRFARSGVALARWDPREPFSNPLEEVARFRRALRHVPA